MAADPEVELEEVLRRFGDAYVAGAPFREDARLREELQAEMRPVAEAFLRRCPSLEEPDLGGLEYREGLAMLTLLGRRAGRLGATPTATLAIVPALLEAISSVRVAPLPAAFRDPMLATCVEGFAAGTEERLRAEAEVQLLKAQPMVRIAPRCHALFLRGRLEPERISERVDEFGRLLLGQNGAGCVIDILGLEGASRERALAVFGAHGTARMLGAQAFFSGVSEPWAMQLRGLGAAGEMISIERDFDAALARALEVSGLHLREGSWLRRVFRAPKR
ncbi:MAG: hypothetical protein OEY14_14520 [Myxococcales bacterium]|nr:hypothetical protein [Myxococcales bacterium]